MSLHNLMVHAKRLDNYKNTPRVLLSLPPYEGFDGPSRAIMFDPFNRCITYINSYGGLYFYFLDLDTYEATNPTLLDIYLPVLDIWNGTPQGAKFEAPTKYVTTPIFYVNGPPHIGHLYTALLGDAVSRWFRFLGYPTRYMTGTDEHGMKVQEAARKQEKRHEVAVQEMWRTLQAKDLIYKGKYEGWYCMSDEAFLTNEQVKEGMSPVTVANPTPTKCMVSIESGNVVEWVTEDNYMYRLTEFLPQIERWLDTHPIHPESRERQARAYLPHLRDLSVSRPSSRIPWGIRVPDDPTQTVYVWLDALTNYLTVAGYPTQSASDPSSYWREAHQVMGKDIVKFHAIYWPAFLLGAGLPLPSRLVAHAHWTVEREKMSKSRGNVVDPFESIAKYGVESIRYFLLKGGGIEDDGDWSDLEVRSKLSADLADTYGNLIMRVSAKSLHPTGMWPVAIPASRLATLTQSDIDMIAQIKRLPDGSPMATKKTKKPRSDDPLLQDMLSFYSIPRLDFIVSYNAISVRNTCRDPTILPDSITMILGSCQVMTFMRNNKFFLWIRAMPLDPPNIPLALGPLFLLKPNLLLNNS
eukprot:gene4000-4631_t